MVENPNLLPNGKRKWSKRKGLTSPKERMDELWQEAQDKANESLSTPQNLEGKRVVNDRDLPLDHADKMQLHFESLRGENKE